jgi:hypothetical protein
MECTKTPASAGVRSHLMTVWLEIRLDKSWLSSWIDIHDHEMTSA